MAFSQTNKIKILKYLGWDILDGAFITEPTSDVWDEIGDGAERQTEVETLLTRMDALDTRLTNALDNLEVKIVDVITLREDELEQLRIEGARLTKLLSTLTGLEIRSGGPFSTGTVFREFQVTW